MSNVIAVIGATDPEMNKIVSLLQQAEIPVHQAMHKGKPVHPGVAYQADAVEPPLPPDCTVWRIECDGQAFAGREVVIIDHHRPGDPGYGRPPEEFLPASSVGQVVAQLALLPYRAPGIVPFPVDSGGGRCVEEIERRSPRGLRKWTQEKIVHPRGSIWTQNGAWYVASMDGGGYGLGGDAEETFLTPRRIPADIVLAAAADHCLEAAYRGRCPGVDPDALMQWRAESRAAFQKRPVEAVLKDVEAARAALRSAARDGLADLRGQPSIPELPEAAAREGISFLADQIDRDGRPKVVLMAAPTDLVRRFLAGEIVPGLVDPYGDPARGFAGGYLK